MAEILLKANFAYFSYLSLIHAHDVAAWEDFDIESVFAKDHECEVVEIEDVRDQFAPLRREIINCNLNLTPFSFTNVNCGRSCRDPYTRRRLSKRKYRPQSVAFIQTFESRQNGAVAEKKIRLNISCSCATRKGRKRKGRGRAKFQRGMQN